MDLPEDRVYARHRRHRGAVLIVGTGSVGGLLAVELSRIGVSPLRLVDREKLDVENLVRHPLGATDLGKYKAQSLASLIRQEFPLCEARGFNEDFRKMKRSKQRWLARSADVVVAATDDVLCQRRVNEVALEVGVPSVYPGVWTQDEGNDGEIGEIFWVPAGRGRAPCYLCATAWRPAHNVPGGPRGGMRIDYQVLVSATASVIMAILDPHDDRARILDSERTMMLVHGFMPFRPGVREYFREGAFNYAAIPFPKQPCPACRGQSPAIVFSQGNLSLTLSEQRPTITSFSVRTGANARQIVASVAAEAIGPLSREPLQYIYEWDDRSSPEPSRDWNRTHTYRRAGTFTVTVTVANLAGHDTATQTVEIA